MKKKFIIILFLITIIGFCLRIFQVDQVPVGLSNDEISIAYNAHSIWQTGKDEYGISFPASFKSHNTYKAPLIIYLAAPLTVIFGNTELAVRLPSVLFGSLTIFSLGVLVLQLFKRRDLGLIASFLLALSPWHIYTSRIALESNVALFFLVTGVVLLLQFIHKSRGLFLFLGVISFVLSVYGYHAEWVFTPLFVLTIFIIYRKSGIFSPCSKKKIIMGFLLGFILLLPIGLDYYHNLGTTARANTEFFLNDFRLHNLIASQGHNNFLLQIAITFYFWLASYLQYFSIPYLFFNGLSIFFDYSVMKFGLFLFILVPFFIMGLFELKKIETKIKWFIISWLLLGPVVPSVTLGGANLVRNLISIIPIIIIIALGLSRLIDKGSFVIAKKIIISSLILINFGFFYYSYLTVFPYYLAESWSYGFKEIALFAKTYEGDYDSIVIDPQYGVENNNLVGVPSLFVLYFGEYSPEKYLNEKKDTDGLLQFGKYEFRSVKWPDEKPIGKTLYIVGAFSTPVLGQHVKKVHTISLPTGKEAFVFYDFSN